MRWADPFNSLLIYLFPFIYLSTEEERKHHPVTHLLHIHPCIQSLVILDEKSPRRSFVLSLSLASMVAVQRAAPSGLTVSMSDNDRIPASLFRYAQHCRKSILVDFMAASYSWPRFLTAPQEQMMATFGYGRVSTGTQTTDNQRLELEQAGYQIEQDFWFADEGISGKVAASQRPAFKAMLGQIRKGETLVVSKLDRLGRDAVDVLQTVRQLSDRGIKVVVLQLGNADLTAPAGKLLLSMLAAVAEMERDLLVERTQAGLARAKAEGKKLGRPSKTTQDQRSEIRRRMGAGESVSALARAYGVSRANVIGIRDRIANA